MKLKLKFGQSSSQNYTKALNLAKKFEVFIPSDDNNNNEISLEMEELINKYKLFEKLYLIIHSWKSTEILFDDKQIEINEFRNIFKIIKCSHDYTKAVIPEDHCKLHGEKKAWSCKFLETINFNLPPSIYYLGGGGYKYWFQFGKFENETWIINKEQIKKTLEREANLKELNLCSIFDINKVFKIVDSLPDSININESSDWVLYHKEIVDGQNIEKKAIGIIPKKLNENNENKFSFNNDNENNVRNRFIPKITFDDIGGIEDILDKIRETIELPLKKPEIFKYLGIKPHKGILLYGPPGCGKTLIAKAISNEVNAHFISIKGPELLSKWHGQSEENLREIFYEGRFLSPSIIFFDEIDSIAQRRSGEENLRFDSRFVNQLLTLMDGIEDFDNLCIIASTNRPELIDEALLRPGRFDYILEITKPTKQGCYKIFKIHTNNMPIENKFDKKSFCDKLEGLSGSEIAFIAREGAYNCLRRMANFKELISSDVNDINLKKFIIEEEDFLKALSLLTNSKKNL